MEKRFAVLVWLTSTKHSVAEQFSTIEEAQKFADKLQGYGLPEIYDREATKRYYVASDVNPSGKYLVGTAEEFVLLGMNTCDIISSVEGQ